MTPPNARNLTLALLAAREAVPGLQVVVKPDLLHGRTCIVDRCCNRVYVSSRLTPAQHGEAVIAGLAVLVADARVTADTALIPSPRHRVPDRDWQQTG